jgi:hypothetical protein
VIIWIYRFYLHLSAYLNFILDSNGNIQTSETVSQPFPRPKLIPFSFQSNPAIHFFHRKMRRRSPLPRSRPSKHKQPQPIPNRKHYSAPNRAMALARDRARPVPPTLPSARRHRLLVQSGEGRWRWCRPGVGWTARGSDRGAGHLTRRQINGSGDDG